MSGPGPEPRHNGGSSALVWFLVMAGACVVLAHLVLVWTFEGRGLAMVSAQVLLDTDAYMWMNRVLHIHDSGRWFDHLYPRINPPEGHVQHWTRPLDGLLLLGGGLLRAFWGFREGLYVWGLVLPPIAHLATLWALVWAVRPLTKRHILPTSALPLLLLVFLVQLPVYQVFLAGRPDHHLLLSLLFVLYLGFWLRVMLEDGSALRTAGGLGVVASVAIWTNVEALIFVALGMAGLVLNWVLGATAMGRRGTVHGLLLTGGLLVGLIVEWGVGPFPVREMDTLSLAHVTLMALATAFWAWIWYSSNRRLGTTVAARFGLASAGAVVVLGFLVLLFPEFLQDPLGPMDPLYRETRLTHIQELQPLHTLGEGFWGGLGAVILLAGTGIVALPYLFFRVARPGPADQRVVWLILALLVGLYLALAVGQRRWTDYLALSSVIPYAVLAREVFRRVASRGDGRWIRIMRPLTLVLLVLGPLLAGGALQATHPAERTGLPEAEEKGVQIWADPNGEGSVSLPVTRYSSETGICDLVQIGEVLSDRGAFPEPALLLAHTDAGPELLYRTPHSVLSIPNHRIQPGYRFTRAVMGHPEPARAAAMLRDRGVGAVVLCAQDIDGGFFLFPDPSFAEWLREGGVPEGFSLHASNRFVRIYRRSE